jgi:hypothetical protein
MSDVIVALGDLHSGSTQALMPENFMTAEGNAIQQNKVQRGIGDAWLDLTTKRLPEILADDKFTAVLMGDLIEGTHHHTKEVISPSKYDQNECALQLLKPVVTGWHDDDWNQKCELGLQCESVYLLKGTELHSGQSELAIGKALHAKLNPDKQRAFDKLFLDVHGCRCVFQHHVVTAMRTYLEASGIGIQLNHEQLEAAKSGEPLPKVAGYAHRHRFGCFMDASGIVFVSPPWQGLTRHGHRVVNAARTKIGAIVLDWRGKPRGALPTVKPLMYNLDGSRIEM